MKLLAWFGVLAPAIRLSLIAVLGLLQAGYSHARDYISELGAAQAPYASIMNYAGTILVGILLSGFSIALWQALKGVRLGSLGPSVLALAGIAFVGVGVFPCDPGCSMESASATMERHILAGTVAMFSQTAAPLIVGISLLAARRFTNYAWTSIGLGATSIIALATLFSQDPTFEFSGALQKSFQAAADIWVFASAVFVLSRQQTLSTCQPR